MAVNSPFVPLHQPTEKIIFQGDLYLTLVVKSSL